MSLQVLPSASPNSPCLPPTFLFHLLHRQLQPFDYLQASNLFSLHPSPGQSLLHRPCDVSSTPSPSVQSLGHMALPSCAWGKVQNQWRAKAQASQHAETQQEEGVKLKAGSLSAPMPRAQGATRSPQGDRTLPDLCSNSSLSLNTLLLPMSGTWIMLTHPSSLSLYVISSRKPSMNIPYKVWSPYPYSVLP